MRVIGTAGHVDHGKSTLIQALTGMNPDRLKEEQEREMTIDLGFAWMTLPNGESVGFVDVPGHRDFIANMLAGIGGVDAALLVVAADEGPMPQTREHLAIMDVLQIDRAMVVLSKVDLVEDEAWLQLVQEEITELLGKTRFAGAKQVRVSSTSGAGLEGLVVALQDLLGETRSRVDMGRPRLPVDRVFTMSGFGTVVTGTLIDGVLQTGQSVEILPQGLRGRIRGLQTHSRSVETAVPGSRVAANLSGVEVNDLARGNVLALPDSYAPTTMLDLEMHVLDDSGVGLRHNQEVKLFLGSSQELARVRILGGKELRPGETGWVQLLLENPVVAVRGDHFILRRPSPGVTLGGGRVADPHPVRRHRLRDPAVWQRLEKLLEGSAADVLIQALLQTGPVQLEVSITRAGLDSQEAQAAFKELRSTDRLVILKESEAGIPGDVWIADSSTWRVIQRRVGEQLRAYHAKYPSRAGMPREELKSRLGLGAVVFSVVAEKLAEEGSLVESGPLVREPKFAPSLTEGDQEKVGALLEAYSRTPYGPPTFKEASRLVGGEAVSYLLSQGILVQVSEEVLLEADAYERMVAGVREALQGGGTIKVSEVRDMFDTSRRYALALMEHLDAKGVTVRDGDVRRLPK